MSPINMQCSGCGRTVQAPESTVGQNVKCPTCGKELTVPNAEAGGRGTSGELELTCRDCGKVFSVPLDQMGEVVTCPSCGSWVSAGQRRRSVLAREVPMPFEGVASILHWLRFFAGFNLLIGMVAAVWVGIVYTTKPVEVPQAEQTFGTITLKPGLDEQGRPTGDYRAVIMRAEKPNTPEEHVINPMGVGLTLILFVIALLGSVTLMALHWLVENMRTLIQRQAPPTKKR